VQAPPKAASYEAQFLILNFHLPEMMPAIGIVLVRGIRKKPAR